MEKIVIGNCKHGKGVFTTEHIHAGGKVLQFEGSVVASAELPKPYFAENDYYLQIGDGIFLGPSGGEDDFVNHSCCPNTDVVFDSGDIKLVTITPIPAGSEITFDYSTTMDNFWGKWIVPVAQQTVDVK